MLINVLIQFGNPTLNLALSGPQTRFGWIGHASPTGSVRVVYGASLYVMSKSEGWRYFTRPYRK